MNEIIIASVITAAVLLAGTVVLVLFHFGLIYTYQPVKKAKRNQIRVACVGDSITYGLMVRNWRKNNYPAVLQKLLGADYCVNNFAYTNRTAIKSADYPLVQEKIYWKSLDFQPNIVFVLLGSNDTKETNWNAEKYIKDYGEIIDSYLSLESAPKVCVLIPPPVFKVRGKEPYSLRNAVIANEIMPAVRSVAKDKGIDCIDLYEIFQGKKELFADGAHPNVNGSRLLARTVYDYIKNYNVKSV